jgi:crescentin
MVRQRISQLMDRLDDARSLKDDFEALVGQVADISAALPHATTRIAELEKVVSQEREQFSRVRRDGQDAAERAAALARDLAIAGSRLEKVDAEIKERDQTIEQLQLSLRDKAMAVEDLERQLFVEVEQSKTLLAECQALRAEAQASDAALSRSEHELNVLRERARGSEHDSRRLQTLAEEQSEQIASLQSRLLEMETGGESERQEHRALQEKFALEAAARQRLEAQYEVESSAFRSERASMALKIDGLIHKANTSEKIATQLRNQMRERDEANRATERALKEAVIAKAAGERRRESLEADLARQAERFADLQRAKEELAGRCDMLTKALAAKDAAIAQGSNRSESLEERIERLAAKHESERSALETANRRLVEDLENERSERLLIQGALEIARESRLGLQKQLDTLKRSMRFSAAPGSGDGSEAGGPGDNVHPFTPGKS